MNWVCVCENSGSTLRKSHNNQTRDFKQNIKSHAYLGAQQTVDDADHLIMGAYQSSHATQFAAWKQLAHDPVAESVAQGKID